MPKSDIEMEKVITTESIRDEEDEHWNDDDCVAGLAHYRGSKGNGTGLIGRTHTHT